MSWTSLLTLVSEVLKYLNQNIFTSRKRAQDLEEEKQEALQKAKELAYGDDEKAMEKHLSDLPD